MDLVGFVLGKTAFMSFALAVPMLRHAWLTVVGVYVGTTALVGLILGVVFQLAHCVEDAQFSEAPATRPRLGDWAGHQVATTVDFAPRNRLLSWYLGGLNYQIEHHLFPRVAHVHYRALAPIVREVAARFGIRHFCHPTMGAALRSHFRHLRQLGRSEMDRPREAQLATWNSHPPVCCDRDEIGPPTDSPCVPPLSRAHWTTVEGGLVGRPRDAASNPRNGRASIV
jgi:fatty acid desaturase